VEAEATRQATRGQNQSHSDLWRLKAQEDGRLRKVRPSTTSGKKSRTNRTDALKGWLHIGQALAGSTDARDVRLAGSISVFIQEANGSWISQNHSPEISQEKVNPAQETSPKIHR